MNADIQSSRVNLKRFEVKQNSVYKTLGRSIILRKLKLNFSNRIEALTSNGMVSRRYILGLLKENNYFNADIRNIVRTTEVQGLEPMTVFNFDKKLIDFYQVKDKI